MAVTPFDGVRSIRHTPPQSQPNVVTQELPAHLVGWQLPPHWRWGSEGVRQEYRHYQEIIDALGRSLALVTAPDPAHSSWLAKEARYLAHRNHSSIPTTYHYWSMYRESRRGPGYLRRWLAAETVGSRARRLGREPIPTVLRVLRSVGSAIVYLHDTGQAHGDISPESVWMAPAGRTWILGWQWAVPRNDIPTGLSPDPRWTPWPPEWNSTGWAPTFASDQWMLAATCFASLTGELPPSENVPPLDLIHPGVPQAVVDILGRALSREPGDRFPTVSALLRTLEHAGATPRHTGEREVPERAQSDEARLRWAVGDDYEILGFLGRGTFGSVWRARDLSLEREVALKVLHPHVVLDQKAVARFRREARLAAQLVHPAIIPIFDWDDLGEVSWYTMELAEGGSVADLVARAGPRPFDEVAPALDEHLDPHVVGDEPALDELPRELEVGPRCRREADLDLLEPHPHQRLEEAQLARRVHGLDERLVPVAQVHRAPARRLGDAPVWPRAAGQTPLEGRERPVRRERHPRPHRVALPRATRGSHAGRRASYAAIPSA